MVFLWDEICRLLPDEIGKAVKELDPDRVREISLRTGRPVAICADRLYFADKNRLTLSPAGCMPISSAAMERTLERICHGSVYAMRDSLVRGFISLDGGHRAGVCGKTVIQKGEITHITDISSISIRIAHQIKGAADGVMSSITSPRLQNTLIISPPACGKTTLLRDIARQLANERYMYRVGIVDERGEIAASHRGTPQMDVGVLSDVYHLCPKAEGMSMLLRSMSPQVVITDEIGTREDSDAMLSLVNAGIKIICSAHAYGKEDLMQRSETAPLLSRGVFERIIVLSSRCGVGTVERIYQV